MSQLNIKSYEGMNPCSLRRENIEDIGRSLKRDHGDFQGNDFEVGCNQIFVDFKEIIAILNERFEDDYLLVLPERGWNTYNFLDQTSQIKRFILHESHAVFTSNPNTIKWMLGKDYGDETEFKKLFKSLKPCIHGSDAHSFDELCNPNKKRYCWIKADTTFEGLKTIPYEPHGRVKIQTEKPNKTKNIYSICSAKISNSAITSDLSIQESKIDLNENLVAIIGGKGTGKTALLDLIANCFEDRCKRIPDEEGDKNSFVQRIQEYKEDLSVEISFLGNEENFSKKLIEESFFPKSKITYLPQGRIEDYSTDRKLLDDIIEDIIFKNEKISEKGCKQQFDELEIEIKEISKKIDEINYEIYELEIETDPDTINLHESELKIKMGEIENKKHELKVFRSAVEEDISVKIQKLEENERELKLKHYQISNILSKLKVFEDNLEEYLASSKENIDDLNSEFKEFGINFNIPYLDFDYYFISLEEPYELLYQEIDILEDDIKLSEEKHSELNDKEIKEFRIIEELGVLQDSVNDLKSKIDVLNQKKEQINELEYFRFEKYQILLKKYMEWNDYYKKVIKIFYSGKDEILNDVYFEPTIYFDKKSFLKRGSEIFDLRRTNEKTLNKLADDLFNFCNSNDYFDEKEFFEFTNSLGHMKEFLIERYDNYEFYKWAYKNYFSLRPEIFFNGRSMNMLSMGQKGTVLLKLFLAEGEHPLIIDQPEDNLDNKFIYNELVGAFRDAKNDRQIIIATNNANLVVNADAEQVIVAEFEDNEIFYESGSLENLNTRSKIISILEGGKKAFIEREEKYEISSESSYSDS